MGKIWLGNCTDWGYPLEEDLKIDEFEWLFSVPSVRVHQFLEWFVKKLDENTRSLPLVLSAQQKYVLQSLLKEQPEKTLDDLIKNWTENERVDEPARAIENQNSLSGTEKCESLESMEDACSQLEKEIEEIERKINVKMNRKTKLSNLVKRKQNEVCDSFTIVNKANKDDFILSNERLNERINSLENEIMETCAHLKTDKEEKYNAVRLSFLFFESMEDIQLQEYSYLSQLEDIFNKIQSGNVAKAETPNTPNNCEKMNFDYDSLRIFKNRPKVNEPNEFNLEMKRLKVAFSLSERQSLAVEIKQKSAGITLEKDKLRNFLSKQYELCTLENLKLKRDEMLQSIQLGKTQLNGLLETSLPALYEALGEINCEDILNEDFEAKLNRQKCRLQVQTETINLLKEQYYRISIVHYTLLSEKKKMEYLSRQFKDLSNVLNEECENCLQRMEYYQDVSTKEFRSENNRVIDTNDCLLQFVHSALKSCQDGEGETLEPILYNELIDLCTSEVMNEKYLENRRSNLDVEVNEMLSENIEKKAFLKDCIFDSSLKPQLCSSELRNLIEKALSCRDFIDRGFEYILDDLLQKRSSLDSQPNAVGERNLFVDFFLNQQELQRKFELRRS